MEVDQTSTQIVEFSLQGEEGLQLCIHLDLTHWEEVLPLDSVALHVPLNDRGGVIPLLFGGQSEESLPDEPLEE